jgi:hypothetical protein
MQRKLRPTPLEATLLAALSPDSTLAADDVGGGLGRCVTIAAAAKLDPPRGPPPTQRSPNSQGGCSCEPSVLPSP